MIMLCRKYPPKTAALCCNMLMVIFSVLKYIRKSLGSFLISEQIRDAFQKGVAIYIQKLFFCRESRKTYIFRSSRAYLLGMKIVVWGSDGIISGFKMSKREIFTGDSGNCEWKGRLEDHLKLDSDIRNGWWFPWCT